MAQDLSPFVTRRGFLLPRPTVPVSGEKTVGMDQQKRVRQEGREGGWVGGREKGLEAGSIGVRYGREGGIERGWGGGGKE